MLSLEDRWKLYRHWLLKYVEYLKKTLQMKENQFNGIFEDYKKARAELDEEILRQASVIAMTTTGAAKYHELLMKIGPQITIIEEAAEVPEAHIVTAINPECEHLILIGDHKQLEPKPAVRELATRFNLSISLFERMLNNGLEYDCLQRQHRMRPDISELVRHMYPKLYDNANVLEYENVKGIRQNLFFINHEHHEQYNADGKSFTNEHEAEYVKELCTYLLKQGYKRNEITILAAYTGQMFLIRSKMPRAQFEGINISVLDNYQGEENEIILLSLVRNNKNGDIGFLRRENRICVALSRAKKALYILGNSGTLTKDSNEWRTVIQKIKSNNREDTNHACPRPDCGTSFGQALPLYCRNHPENEGIRAELPADFARAPEGGFELFCGLRLECGHVCRLRCHPYDKNHVEYECMKMCPNICDENHKCNKRCHFPKSCECEVIMERTLQCQHTAMLKCHIDPSEHECLVEVKRTLLCDHNVILKCHINYGTYMCREIVSCTRNNCGHEYKRKCYDVAFERKHLCEIKVDKTLECGHIEIVQCYRSTNRLSCTKKCLKKCDNNHICDRVCHISDECHCNVKINKILPRCGHNILIECSKEVDQTTTCNEQVDFILEICGHRKRLACSEKHKIETAEPRERELYEKKTKCSEIIPVDSPLCGHTILVECWKKFDIKEADKGLLTYIPDMSDLKCSKEVLFYLQCGHLIKTICYKKLSYEKSSASTQKEGKAGIECETMVDLDLVCGHKITVKCFEKFRYESKKKLFSSLRLLGRRESNINCTVIVDIELRCGHIGRDECWKKNQIRSSFNAVLHKLANVGTRRWLNVLKGTIKSNVMKSLSIRTRNVDMKSTLNVFNIQICKNCNVKPKVHCECVGWEGEECDRPLCLEDCKHKLTCGHKCPGFCSELCPVSCKDCDATNFMNGSEGIKVVTIAECRHSFGYMFLDRHMEETANELTSQCPGCGKVFNWHPRYNKILKRKKMLTEELKENFQNITIQSKYTFPLCDSKIVQQFHNYIGSFNTYVQIISYIARGRNNAQIKSLQASAENILKAMRKITSKCLQNYIDISDAIFCLYVNWMLQLVRSNEKLLERNMRKFNGNNITQNQQENSEYSHDIPVDNIDSSSELIELKTSRPVIKGIKGYDRDTKFEIIDLSAMFEENDLDSMNRVSKSMENGCDGDTSINQKVEEISQTEVEECLTGLDIVRKIEDTMICNQKSEVKRLLNIMIPFMRNEPHFTEAMQCPQLTSVTAIGVHEKDWKICKKGHLTSTLIHQNCYTCSAASTSKVSGESKEGVLWKTHFQPLTEKSEWDKYNQGKGNVMGAQQRRNKRNKSNKNRMSETFEMDTKQTNTQEVLTHIQSSNRSSDNLTFQDYIHPNTDGGYYRGNSRGRGRGRGKKNQQTVEVAGRSFQTRSAEYQGYNTDFNSSVGRPQRGYSASNFIDSNFGRSTEGRGTGHNGIWQRNTVPHQDQVVPHHDPVAGHNGIWQRNSVPHHEQVVSHHDQEAGHDRIWQRNIVPHQEQVAGTFGINMQQNKINNEPNENFKPFKGGFGRPKYKHSSSDSRPGSRGQRGRGRRGRRGGRGERN
ncbi:NFX1-type zinc finger-containing protein 1 [Mytilus coruscus]|uniref:NFX1-type zinc finger-containing protein 1 n=1 Tax=Mytilus coruscus TaxID=42192 RepID=A0A6J8ETK0_MYTCO|nr:NFX1-type zinc finger-containing protein 1 [Mytilus coruscus]